MRELAPTAPTALTDAIEALLYTKPAERTATAELFVDALSDCAPTPVARRRLADLVCQRGGLKAPRPGHEPTSAGPLDTELEGHFDPALAPAAVAPQSPPKAAFKSTVPATPGMVQAAETARAAAAAMGLSPGDAVPKSTVPGRPKALASSPPPAMPVPQGTVPATPGSKQARPAPTPTLPEGTLSSHADRSKSPGGVTTGVTKASPIADVRFPSEPESDEIVLPVERPRLAIAVGVVGVVLLIGSATVFGLRARSTTAAEHATAAAEQAVDAVPSANVVGDQPGSVASDPSPTAASPESVPTGVAEPAAAAGDPALPDRHRHPAPAAPGSRQPDPAPPTAPSSMAPSSMAPSSMARTPQAEAPVVAEAPDPAEANPAVVMDATPMSEVPVAQNMGAEPRAEERGASSGSARVVIRSEPWGSVWVDGRYIGRSPATVVLPVGSHVLGGGLGHIMGTRRVRVTSRPNQRFVVHVDYPGQ